MWKAVRTRTRELRSKQKFDELMSAAEKQIGRKFEKNRVRFALRLVLVEDLMHSRSSSSTAQLVNAKATKKFTLN